MEEQEGAAEAVDVAVVVVATIHTTGEVEAEDADEGAVVGAVLLHHHPHPLTGRLKIAIALMKNGMP